jgi:phosphoribosylformimino-5-aminoimidazole carboxamide ribonucleotide (ProFAR) isomerase
LVSVCGGVSEDTGVSAAASLGRFRAIVGVVVVETFCACANVVEPNAVGCDATRRDATSWSEMLEASAGLGGGWTGN